MAFKEVTSLDADTTISLGGRNKKTGKANPTSAEGYYLGSRQVKSPLSKTGTSPIHFLQTSKGNVGVWGKTDMDRKLSAVPTGTMIRISFDKMVRVPTGEMYKFKVEVDDSNTIEVAATAAPAQAANVEEDYDTYAHGSDDEGTDDSSDSSDDEDMSQAAALAQLERKNKVQALLKNKGRN